MYTNLHTQSMLVKFINLLVHCDVAIRKEPQVHKHSISLGGIFTATSRFPIVSLELYKFSGSRKSPEGIPVSPHNVDCGAILFGKKAKQIYILNSEISVFQMHDTHYFIINSLRLFVTLERHSRFAPFLLRCFSPTTMADHSGCSSSPAGRHVD